MDTSRYSQQYLDASKQGEIIGVCTFLIIVSIASVALRFYARWVSRMDFSWDDWFCLAGLPFALLSPIFDFIQLSNGFGKHQVTVPPADIERYGYYLYILLLFYNPGLVFFKLSFLAFYLRVFPITRWLRYSAYILGGMIIVWFLGTEFAFIFRCNPISAAWNPAAGTCIDEHTVFLAQSIPTIFFDLAILVLPVRLVWNLQMAVSSRIGVISIFMLGGVVTIISIARLVVTLTSNDADLTWGYVDLGLWSAAEPVTGLLCCCLSTYLPFFKSILRALGITSKNDSSPPISTLKRHRFSDAPTIPPSEDGFDKRDSGSDTYELTRPWEAMPWGGSGRAKSSVYAAGGSDTGSLDDDLERGQSRRGETLQEILAASRIPDRLAPDAWQGGITVKREVSVTGKKRNK